MLLSKLSMIWLAVLVGGALGAVARHGVNVAFTRALGTAGPYATAAVNMLGSFVIGFLAGGLASQRLTMTTPMRAFIFVGIIGGFTTFSSFVLDSLTLLQRGASVAAAANLVGQVLVGLALVYAGYRLGLWS
jgi:CrcB protein